MGFLVNLVGIYAFQHGHGHSHGGGGSHSHGGGGGGHSNRSNNVDHFHNQNSHGHSHNDHGHSHGAPTYNSIDFELNAANSQIMKGVFLHILADTLGSVGVIISAVLMQMFGWMRADPICSMFIALLIGISVLALIKDSIAILMQRQPTALDHILPQCYQRVTALAGVYSVQEPHFWTLCSDIYVGGLKLEVSKNVDPKYVITHTQLIFADAGVKQLFVQLDYTPM